jgi:hypothetical protein
MAVLPPAYHGQRFCPNEQIYANQQHVGLTPENTLLCCAFIADCSRDTNFVLLMSVPYFSTAVYSCLLTHWKKYAFIHLTACLVVLGS